MYQFNVVKEANLSRQHLQYPAICTNQKYFATQIHQVIVLFFFAKDFLLRLIRTRYFLFYFQIYTS